MPKTCHWEIRTGARLHFGLLSFGGEGPQFGGAGLMLQGPPVRLVARPTSGSFSTSGPADQRVREFARRWSESNRQPLSGCELQILEVPPQHAGLGSGTQLALATAALLNRFFAQPAREMQPDRLTVSVQRGLRSAVGTYGFTQGGLIIERGKLPGQTLAPLEERIAVPPEWHFLLLRPRQQTGLSGAREVRAFRDLPAVPAEVTCQLRDILRRQIVPAVKARDCDSFGEAVYEYGWRAGNCFAPVQGGPYNGERIRELVSRLRKWGVRGVGQSSWGPTIFAVFPQASAAAAISQRIERTWGDRVHRLVASPLNRGADLRAFEAESVPAEGAPSSAVSPWIDSTREGN